MVGILPLCHQISGAKMSGQIWNLCLPGGPPDGKTGFLPCPYARMEAISLHMEEHHSFLWDAHLCTSQTCLNSTEAHPCGWTGLFFIMWIHPILSVVLISVHGHWIKDLQNTRSSSFHSMETVIHSYFWFQIRGDINRFKPVCCHCMQQLGTWNVSDCKCTASFRPALYL